MPNNYPLASYTTDAPLLKPWTTPFNAPQGVDDSNDPGYAARLNAGSQTIQRSAASRGTLLTGGTLKGLERYAQDYGSNEYDKIYNRARDEYLTAQGIYSQNQANQFNRLSSYAQSGQQAAENMGSTAQGYSGQYGNVTMGGAGRLGDIYGQQGNAQAGGTVGAGNAWGGAVSDIGQSLPFWWYASHGMGAPGSQGFVNNGFVGDYGPPAPTGWSQMPNDYNWDDVGVG